MSQDSKALEFHIPTRFDANRPALAFHHEVVLSTIDEHPLASRLPSASRAPKLVACADDFVPLMHGPGDPVSLQDYLQTDRPMLGLRIVSFNDATLVTLSCSHVLLDGLGRKAILDAWSLVLQGRDQEVMDLQGVYEDPFATLGTQLDASYKHRARLMGFSQLFTFGVRALLQKTFYQSDIKGYMICLPGSYVRTLRSQAMRDITKGSDAAVEAPFLSDGDVLCAWWSKYIASCVSNKPGETLVINNVLGLRPTLTPELLRAESPYISNAIMMMPTFNTVGGILTQPLGEVALSMRQTIEGLSTRAQVEARFSLDRAWHLRTGSPALYGDPWMRMIICTNWVKSKIHEVDFSAALLNQKSNNQNAGCPTYTQLHAFAKGFDLVNAFSISKDADDNYWIYSQLDAKHRSKVEQMLRDETH